MMNPPNSLPDFLAELRKRVNGALRTDTYSKVLYSTDASIYQVMPHGVMIPEHVEHVHAAVELAAKYEIPLLPRTAGSSLAGQAVNEALVIDFSRHLNEVVAYSLHLHRLLLLLLLLRDAASLLRHFLAVRTWHHVDRL